jgi:ligand-binding sensor domain-containing protein
MKPKLAARILLMGAIAALPHRSACGLDPTKAISQYAHNIWRMQDGLFLGVPVAIAQTADGYLWIGTPNGLMRFDGARFVPWNPPDGQPLPRTDILSLLSSRDGSLWIGTGRGLARWKAGVLTSYADSGDHVFAILESKNGTIWIARSQIPDRKGPLCRVSGDHVECLGDAAGIPLSSATRLAEDTQGNIWVGGFAGLCRWKTGSSNTYFKKEFDKSKGLIGVEALATDHDGSLWAGIERSGTRRELQRFADGAWKGYVLPGISGTNSDISTLFIDRDNTLWIGTGDRGIFRVRNGNVEHFGSADGLSSDAVATFYQDREGTMWIGTSKGVDSFRDFRVVSFSIREGLTADSVSTVLAGHDDTVWIGNSGAVNFLRAGKLSAIRERHGLPGRNVTTMFEDHSGRLWIGVDSALSIYEQGSFRPVRKPDGSSLGVVFSITEDSEHNIWALAGRKLLRIQDLNVKEDIASPQISTAFVVVSDPKGGIWLGLTNGDLIHYKHSQTQTFSPDRSVTSAQIRAIAVNSDGSIWGATLKGLVRWKGGIRKLLTTKNGLPCNDIFTLINDGKGSLWLYTRCGLVEIANSQLRKWWEQPDAVVALRTFDVFDGVQAGSTPLQPQAARSADGRLWFANDLILQMIDPQNLQKNLLPPPVYIESVVADRTNYVPEGDLRLPRLTRDLEIDYTALSFVVPQKVRYRYMLEGHDRGWQEPENRRQAFYNGLAPGQYRFRVVACNNDGVWNESGAALNFEIPPMFYQTNWFLALCGMSAATILWLLYLFRMRQMADRIKGRLEERLGERERIARELHDTLLQSIQGLILRFHVVAEKIPSSDPARAMMEKTLERADEVLVEGRDRVRNLRVSGGVDRELPQAFVIAGEDLAQESAAEFKIVVEGAVREVHPVVRDEIYWIGHEALVNSFQHACASRIEIELTYERKELRLRFRDDGRGISSEILQAGGRKGHWGMPGMRERARKIGARLVTWSRPGAGTEVEIKIPGSLAYGSNGKQPRWQWLRAAIRRGRTE